jgi:hypothetical protein
MHVAAMIIGLARQRGCVEAPSGLFYMCGASEASPHPTNLSSNLETFWQSFIVSGDKVKSDVRLLKYKKIGRHMERPDICFLPLNRI